MMNDNEDDCDINNYSTFVLLFLFPETFVWMKGQNGNTKVGSMSTVIKSEYFVIVSV